MGLPEVTILLIGSDGSGKSAFIKKMVNFHDSETHTRSGHSPSTIQVVHKIKNVKTLFSFINTPDLVDNSKKNLQNLKVIAAEIEKRRSQGQFVTGAIWFHSITDRRITGTTKLKFDIFLAICGPDFHQRIACVTTKWDDVAAGKEAPYRALSKQLRAEEMNLSNSSGGGVVFDLELNKPDVFVSILNHFVQFNTRYSQLLIEKEIKTLGVAGVKKTSAGRTIVNQARGESCVSL